MKWKSKMKRTATTTSAILLALMLAACSDNNTTITPTATPDTEQTDQGSIPSDNLPDGTGTLDPGTPTPDQDEQGSGNDGNGDASDTDGNVSYSDVLSAEGIYIGAADNHSVEIKVDNDYLMFQIDDTLEHIITDYAGNEAVTFEYVEKTIEYLGAKQLWLKSIEKK